MPPAVHLNSTRDELDQTRPRHQATLVKADRVLRIVAGYESIEIARRQRRR